MCGAAETTMPENATRRLPEAEEPDRIDMPIEFPDFGGFAALPSTSAGMVQEPFPPFPGPKAIQPERPDDASVSASADKAEEPPAPVSLPAARKQLQRVAPKKSLRRKFGRVGSRKHGG